MLHAFARRGSRLWAGPPHMELACRARGQGRRAPQDSGCELCEADFGQLFGRPAPWLRAPLSPSFPLKSCPTTPPRLSIVPPPQPGPDLAEIWLELAKFGPHLPVSGRTLLEFGKLRANFGRNQARCRRVRANVGRFGANSGRLPAKFGRRRSISEPKWAEFRRILADLGVGRNWLMSGRI